MAALHCDHDRFLHLFILWLLMSYVYTYTVPMPRMYEPRVNLIFDKLLPQIIYVLYE